MTPRLAALLLAGLLLSGCATTAVRSGEGAARGARFDRRALWHYANGLYAQKRSDPARALAEFQQASRFDPKSATLHNRLAYHYYVEGMDQKTIEELRKALESDPRNIEVRSTLASLYASQGEYHKAQREYLRILSADPGNAEARYYLAGVLAAQNKTDEAVQTYQAILDKDPTSPTAHYDMGLVYTKRGEVEKAEKAFKRAIELDPAFESAYSSLGLLYELNLKPQQAVTVYRRLAEIAPNNAQPFLALGELHYNAREYEEAWDAFEEYHRLKPRDASVLDYIGLCAMQLKHHPQAVAAFEELLEAQPNNVLVMYRLAGAYGEAGQMKKAEQTLRRILVRDPKEADAWVRLILLLEEGKRGVEVEKALKDARAALPDENDLDLIQAMIWHRRDEIAKAEEAYRRVLSRDPKNPTVLFNLGVVLDKRKDPDGAIAMMLKAIESDPNYAEAYNYVGYSWAERGVRLGEAKRMLEKALALDPDNPYFLDSYAWVLYRKGFHASAWAQMEKCIAELEEPRKEDAVIFEHAAQIRLKLKDKAGAALYWRKALELDPDNADYPRRMQEAVR
jgi:tetratricopeptide (TPR) repeat protein